jgi:hypothetical protein
MKVIVTGSRELEYCEPFFSQGLLVAERVTAVKQRELQRKLTPNETGIALSLGMQTAMNAVRDEVFRKLDDLHSRFEITTLVHGGARGVDRYADTWALENNVDVVVYKPRWMKDGVLDKAAGFKRNWYMLFSEAGQHVATDFARNKGRLALQRKRIDRLIERAKESGNLHHLHLLVEYREVLADSFHPARRSVLRRVGVRLPQDVTVVAFHDYDSRGTSHCIMAAKTLGFITEIHRYERRKLPETGIDRAKIDHRPGKLPAFGTSYRVR